MTATAKATSQRAFMVHEHLAGGYFWWFVIDKKRRAEIGRFPFNEKGLQDAELFMRAKEQQASA